jgi:hypothetical protein
MSIGFGLLGIALAAAVLVGSWPSAASAQAGERALLAIYYPWFSPHNFGPGQTSDSPAQPYESDDPVAIARQIEEAQQAGIDGFVVAWLGPGNRTDQNLARILAQAARRGFKVSVYFETDSMGDAEQVAANLSYLLTTHATQPAFLRHDGRPSIFFWRQQAHPPATWAEIRARVDPEWRSVWIAEGTTADYFATFDGLHLFNIAWAPDPARPLQTWAGRTAQAASVHGPRLWVPTIMPGYDDLATRGTFARDRAAGGYYQATMEAALATNPTWAVLITSWNEWPEGTQIEPSVSYGRLYLDLTAAFKARWP